MAGGQDHEVRYGSKKTGKSKGAVKRAVKRVGTSRKKVDKPLGSESKSKTRPSTKRRGGSSTRSKVTGVAKKVATATAVAAGLALAGTVVGEVRGAETPNESSTPHANEH